MVEAETPTRDAVAPPRRRSRLKRGFVIAGLGVVALGGVLVIRAATFSADLPGDPPSPPLPGLDVDRAAERLSGAIRIPTVSHEDPSEDEPDRFTELASYLEATYPGVHASLTRETIAESSLLYVWPGSDPSLPPLLLLAHMDVVPVEPGTEGDWTHEAFSGDVADGFVWGRGSLDDKLGVIAQHEAIEALLATGWSPTRSVILGFGHDEEVGGERGQAAIASTLRERNIVPAMVVDEGGAVVEGTVPGLERPAALVGIAEKGYVTLALDGQAEGGHSSMPPEHTAIGRLAAAISRLESEPFDAELSPPTRMMFETLGPHLAFGPKVVAANLWLLEGVLVGVLASAPATAPVVRTTTAATVIQGGTKANVLPANARALINHRTMPGDTAERVRERVESIVEDEHVAVSVVQGRSATAISDVGHPGYASLARAIRWTFPNAVVAPYLVVGGTDARHYDGVTPAVYRFLPIRFDREGRERMHGTNERIAVTDVGKAIEFYVRLIVDFAG